VTSATQQGTRGGPSVLIVIPARGGSKGIPRKNLRALGGRPLLSWTVGRALDSRHDADVVVSSDAEEIAALAVKLGARVHRRQPSLATDAATLDEVIVGSYQEIVQITRRRYDVIVTLQPTSPLLTTASLDAAIDAFWADPSLDSMLSAADDTHLTWTRREGRFVPLYKARVNRQQLEPAYRETGGLILCRERVLGRGSRIGDRVSLFILSGPEAIDIDTAEDWALCEWYLAKRDILFVVAGYPEIGLGHVHNALTIADGLVRHRIRFLVTRPSALAQEVLSAHHFEVHRQSSDDLIAEILALGPEVVINDRLDTSAKEIRRLKAAGKIVVNFEDLGDGAPQADLVVNAIYPERESLPNHYFGPRHFCIRNEFVLTQPRPVRESVRSVLLTFGGVDPNNLTGRVVAAIYDECRRRDIAINVVTGGGYTAFDTLEPFDGIVIDRAVSDMADRIRGADLAFTSAGRTIFELAALGTPAIVLAQNEREMTHFFAYEEHGFRNLGLGTAANPESILRAFVELVDDFHERQRMSRRMLDNELRAGTERVIRLIETTIGDTCASGN